METVCALISQVRMAMPKRGTERDVITICSRPMWARFLEEIGGKPSQEPTEWISDPGKTWRVFGSETRLVDSDECFSYSYSKTP